MGGNFDCEVALRISRESADTKAAAGGNVNRGEIKMKKVYYFTEVENLNSYRQAERIKADSITSAKRIASRHQVFKNTWLKLGLSTDNNGFIKNLIAVKNPQGRWEEV